MYNTTDSYKSKIYNVNHFLKVYINDVEIESKYILDCRPSSTLFTNGEIELGSTPSQTIELKLYKSVVPATINKVEIKSGITGEIVPVGVYNVDKAPISDDYTVTLSLADNMIKFEFNYDGSKLVNGNNGKVKIIQVLQDMCSKAGVKLGTTSFLNMNKEIAVYDNTVSARTYLSYISEQAGGFAFIGRDGKLYIRSLGQDMSNISLKLFQNFEWGEKYKITKVRFDDGIRVFEKGNTTGNTMYINPNNMFIVDQEQVDNIYEQVKDLELYSFKGNSIIDPAIDIGDILVIDGKQVLYQGSSQYSGRWKASISSEIKSKERQETTVIKKPSQKTINRRVQSSINQIDGKIEQLVEENTETTEKLTKHEQDINGIKNTVQSIQDFTREKEQNDNIFLDDIAEGEGYVLNFTAYGNSTTFNSKDITICAGTKPRGVGNLIYLTTESGEDLLTEDGQEFIVGEKSYYVKSQKVHLSDVLRSFKIDDTNTVYDTLEVLQDGTIQVTRRIGVNSSGNEYVLENEIIEKINETMILPSLEGKIYYFIDECDNLKYYIKYITQNDYSDSFLGKLNLGTEIEQNAEHVRVAWNQISQFLQLEGIEGKATLSIYDKDKNLLMTLNDEGQHFYENDEIFGEMGVSIEQQSGNTKNRYIAFSVDCEYDNTIGDGMAWGVKTQSDGKFWPILYIKDFTMPPKNSGRCTGKLVLSGCNLELDSEGAGISTSQVRIHGDALPGLYFDDEKANKTLLSIIPAWGNNSAAVQILDNINLYANKAGSNTLKIGDNSAYCFMTDDGSLSASGWADIGGYLLVHGTLTSYGDLCVGQPDANAGGVVYGNFDIRGNVYANNISSDKRIKTKIKNSTINALDIIKKIKHRQFYKDDGKHYDIGYIAQEMEQIDPNFVLIRPKTEKDDEMYYINELPIIATLSKAIQEQQKQIEKIQEEKDEQDKLIKSLIERIEKLEGGK